MMQRTSLLCSSNPFSPLPSTLPTSHPLTFPFRNRPTRLLGAFSSLHLPLNPLPSSHVTLTPLHGTATQEIVETSKSASEFVEIGYISNVHGLQGDIRVKTSTDFPELRFSKPGRRWLKQQILGGERIQEIELEEGRGYPGQKSWILKFRGIDTVDQAKLLIGSTLLVKEDDRPELQEDEFYTRDLVGMRVFLKEGGQAVGTVINVFNSGANDLLHVMLDSSADILNKMGNSKSAETEASGHLVWVPFVEAIVPDVDMERREMLITPPKGLLELNLRFDERSKKERRQLEWKERKKFQKRLIAAKKKLCELEQQHIFHGFRYGEKEQRSLLADQIVGVNSKLLQEALQNMKIPAKRWGVNELVSAAEAELMSTMKISEECLFHASKEKLGKNMNVLEKGLHLMSEGKMAIVLTMNKNETQWCISEPGFEDHQSSETSPSTFLHKLLCDKMRYVKVEDCVSVPLILVCSSQEIQPLRELFSINDHFGFNSEKVWFLEEEKLPVISSLVEGQKYKILMKSPWEILQSPIGSGGVISLFSSHNILDTLSDIGVEYIEICSCNQRNVGANSLLLGLVNSQDACVGIQILKDTADSEEIFDMIFSMDFMKKLTRQINKLQFNAIPKTSSYVEKVEKDWINVTPSSPNSYVLRSTIYSSLNSCSYDEVCILDVA
ncbi:RimM protein [Quillaja saponaria]|uniref:RimM protein n=1 Tax=Quillaja saponaria TaxID=32244 RepID=A0AAD7PVF6_QUISA|nr:RimM protein [Quillaja saponaria]